MTLSVSRRAALPPLALAAAIASVCCSSVLAQTSEGKIASAVIVTASRTPLSAKDVLADYVLITQDEIAQSGQTSLVGVLQKARGIEVSTTGGAGNTSSVFIRGASNAQSIVLVDGVRIGSSTLGGATWETIPLAQIDHIEIVYGPLSSLYGADAMGGVIQIFTRQGDGATRVNFSAGVGSYGLRSEQAGVSGSSGEDKKLRYAIQLGHENDTGFSATLPSAGPYSYNPDKDGYKKDSASGQLGVQLAAGQELGLNFLHSRLDAQFDAGPGYDDRNVLELDNYAIYSRNKLAPSWSSLVQLTQSEDKAGTNASYGQSQINTTQTDLSWQNDIALGADVLQWLLERREEKVADDNNALSGKRSTNSVATSYQLKQGRQLASFALRNDNSSQFGSHTTGSVDYGYRVNDSLRANASLGTSFRAPTFNELYYPGYGIASNKAERGKNAEAGVYYDNGASQISAVYYRNRITDLLVYAAVCPAEPATHPYGCAYNVDKAMLTGLTIGASTALDKFTLKGSLDLQNPHDETTGKRLARRARQHGSVALEYGVDAIKAGAELVVSGERFDDTDNNNRLGGYGLVNLYASYDFMRDWSVFGRWNNITDKHYEMAAGYATPGSNLFVGVRYAMH